MASPSPSIDPSIELPPVAGDVARGVCRLFHHLGLATLVEMPLPNARRADIIGVDAKGQIVICEIKVAVADLRGDNKWRKYLDYCDRFFWAVPSGFPHALLSTPPYEPGRCGLVLASRYEAAIVRPAQSVPLNAVRRRAGILRFGRAAAVRLLYRNDPFCGGELNSV